MSQLLSNVGLGTPFIPHNNSSTGLFTTNLWLFDTCIHVRLYHRSVKVEA